MDWGLINDCFKDVGLSAVREAVGASNSFVGVRVVMQFEATVGDWGAGGAPDTVVREVAGRLGDAVLELGVGVISGHILTDGPGVEWCAVSMRRVPSVRAAVRG
ncbi:MAG TPA: hypothetical protein VGH27_20950 [Streptosporangiaceae bacterium]|jgi:hypothetical protein